MPNTSATGGYLTPTSPLPLDDEDLGRRLSNLVAGVTGLPGNLVRPRWQADMPPIPNPDVNWAAVGVLSYPAERGTPQIIHHSDDDGHDQVEEESDVRCLASFYGPRCAAYARLCRSALWVSQNWEQMRPLGVNLRDVGDVIIIPEKINETWYRRADLSIILVEDLSRTYAVLNVLSAHGVINGSGSNDETVEIPFDTENVG